MIQNPPPLVMGLVSSPAIGRQAPTYFPKIVRTLFQKEITNLYTGETQPSEQKYIAQRRVVVNKAGLPTYVKKNTLFCKITKYSEPI